MLDIVADLGTGLDEHQVVLLGFVLSLLCGDLALVVQVSLVSNQHNNNIIASLGSYVVDPLLCILERLCIYSAVG